MKMNEKHIGFIQPKKKHRNQRKNIGFHVKDIRTNDKTQALIRKTQEPTTKHWFYIKKHRNQRESTGFIKRNIGTNE